MLIEAWVLSLLLAMCDGLTCEKPADPAFQQQVIDRLRIKLWGTPAAKSTCQTSLLSSCVPVIDDV